jgi:hypothetical protein
MSSKLRFEEWVIGFHIGCDVSGEIHDDEMYPALNGKWIYDDWDVQSCAAAWQKALGEQW